LTIQPPRAGSRLWTWLLALLLLALLVWVVGRRVEQRPHPEIGVTGGESLPQGAHATPTPVERSADSPPAAGPAPPVEQGREGQPTSVPASPRPRR